MDTNKTIFVLGTLLLLLSARVSAQVWSYSSEVDDFADTSVHLAEAVSADGQGFMAVRCSAERKLEAFVSTGDFIGTRDKYPVRYRIDKGEVYSDKWGVSTRGTSVFVDPLERAVFSRRLMSGTQLLFEVQNFRGTRFKTTFSLQGSADAVGKVLDACEVSRQEVQIDGVEKSVVKRISLWGPKYTSCQKRMLQELGYTISDSSPKKTPEVYRALQKYMDDNFARCGTSNASISEESYDCKQKDRFLPGVYSDAVDSDESLRELCGSLTINN